MKKQRLLQVMGACVGMWAMFLTAPVVHADDTNGDLFYTTFSGSGDRVFKRPYTFTGGVLSFGLEVGISGIPDGLGGADGLLFDPTNPNFLIVGGQNDHFYRVDVGTGAVTASSTTDGASIFHLAVDPKGTSVWGSGIPDSPIANVDLTGGAGFVGAPALLPILSGGDGVTAITGLAFVGSSAYYTSSPPAGFGSFGKIDLTTGDTTELFAGVPAAHGISFDPFTGDLILMGDSEIRQYDPVTNTFVGILSVPGHQFDQGAVDGKGHLFVASNDSDMFFLDYSGTSDIDAGGNFSTLVSGFKDSLDDVAPLSGLGGHEQPIPEPASMLLFSLGGLGIAGWRRRQKTVSQNV